MLQPELSVPLKLGKERGANKSFITATVGRVPRAEEGCFEESLSPHMGTALGDPQLGMRSRQWSKIKDKGCIAKGCQGQTRAAAFKKGPKLNSLGNVSANLPGYVRSHLVVTHAVQASANTDLFQFYLVTSLYGRISSWIGVIDLSHNDKQDKKTSQRACQFQINDFQLLIGL